MFPVLLLVPGRVFARVLALVLVPLPELVHVCVLVPVLARVLALVIVPTLALLPALYS